MSRNNGSLRINFSCSREHDVIYLASPQFTDLAASRGMRLLRKLRRVAVPHKQFATQQRAREAMDKSVNCGEARYSLCVLLLLQFFVD